MTHDLPGPVPPKAARGARSSSEMAGRPNTHHARVGLSIAMIFVIDWLTPLGYGVWLLYLIPLVLSTWSKQEFHPAAVAGICTALVIARPYLAPPGGYPSGAFIGRTIGVLVIWVIALLFMQRLRVETAFRESEERFSKAFHANPAILALTTLDGENVDVNQTYLDFLGYAREEVLGKTVADLGIISSEERLRILELLQRSGGSVRNAQVATRVRDGGLRHYLLSADLLSVGATPHRLMTLLDITELKQAEDELRRSQAALENAETRAQLGSWDFDPTTQRGDWSRGMFALFARDPALGPPALSEFMELIHPDDRQRLVADQTRAQDKRDSFSGEYRTNPERAPFRVLNASFFPLCDHDGRLVRIVGTALDITERKRVEEELRRLSGRLLQVQDEERRRLARELHDQTAQELGAVAMNLSSLQRLAPDLPQKASALLEETQALTQRAAQEIRTLSYLLHPPVLEEVGLVAAVSDYAKGFAKRSNMDVAVEADAAFGRLPGETELALFRIVQESLGNILKHSGSPTATISFTHDAEEICLEVRDAGRGMAREGLERLGASAGDMGVGIAGMRERMRQLGGRLEIDSSPRGTTVRAIRPVPTDS